MTPASAQSFGVVLAAMWGAAGAVAIGRAAAKSPAARELAAAVRKTNFAAKCALVAGLVCAVAVGGTKPDGNQPRNTPNTRISSASSVVEPPPFALVEVRTSDVALVPASANAVVSESVRRHGTSEGGEWIETEAPFFRWGTNPVSRVYASPAVLSFGTMRHPALGASLPDGSDAQSLLALRTPLGLAPEANWPHLSAPSRFWHERTPGGMVFTWENALLDRQADRPATIQIETWDDGDFAFRYAFSAAAPTNDFFAGAQCGPAAVEALSVRGGVTNSAVVYRVDGALAPDGVLLADLFASPVLELRWKNVAGLGDLAGDTDGDGLSDWQELFLHATDPAIPDTDGDGLSDASEILSGANPLDADEDGDGVPDGVSPSDWAANPLWATNSAHGATFRVTLEEPVPEGSSAVLVLGTLRLPLRAPSSWDFALEPGQTVPFSLALCGRSSPVLSISPPSGVDLQPVRLDDPDRVFRLPAPSRAAPVRTRRARRGAAHPDGSPEPGISRLSPRFFDATTLEPAVEDECIHLPDSSRAYRLKTGEGNIVEVAPDWTSSPPDENGVYNLSVGNEPGDCATLEAGFSESLAWGEASCSVGIHRCRGEAGRYCAACGFWHRDGETCPHEASCALFADSAGTCTCPDKVLRADPSGDPVLLFHGPSGAWCCCREAAVPTAMKLLSAPSFLLVSDSEGRILRPGAETSGSVAAVALRTGGAEELRWEVVRPDGTNSVHSMAVWAADPVFEPVTGEEADGRIANPCAVILGETATFRMELAPANFPDWKVAWSAAPENRVGFVGGNTGRSVEVRGLAEGAVTLRARIEGYAGPAPEIAIRVVEKQTVPVRAFIVGNGTEWAADEAEVRGFLPVVNKIWRQAGIEFGPLTVEFLDRKKWMDLRCDDYSWPEADALCATATDTGGVEWYFVRSLGTEKVAAFNRSGGMVASPAATATTIAHEMGHACGLTDIFPNVPPGEIGPAEGNTYLHSPMRILLEDDWGSESDEGYYRRSLSHGQLIDRLLMRGSNVRSKADVSAGNVDGFRKRYDRDPATGRRRLSYEFDTIMVGFFSMPYRTPQHQ